MVIGNAPWSGIEIKPLLEFAGLRRAAEFGKTVAAPQAPIASARPAVELEYLDFVAGVAQFQRRGHARQARAENQNRRAPGIAIELDRAFEAGLRREAETGHGLIHRSTAGNGADQRQQIAPGEGALALHRFCIAFLAMHEAGSAQLREDAGDVAHAPVLAELAILHREDVARGEAQLAMGRCDAEIDAVMSTGIDKTGRDAIR
jgi:hypothetical protein